MLLPNFLEVLVGSCHVSLVLICPGLGILDGISVLLVCPPDHWNPVIISALRLYVGVLEYPGSALDLPDGTLKLRHCTDIFTMRFLPWSLPRVCNGSGKNHFITPGRLLDAGGNVGKRVRLTRKTRPGVISHSNPDPGHPTPRRWKRLRLPSSEGEGGEGEPRNLFPRLGVG